MSRSLYGCALFSLMILPSVAFSQTTAICDGQAVPAGKVVVKRYTTNNCPGVNNTNELATLDIQTPTSPMDICSESPYPGPNFVVTRHTTTNSCWNLAIKQHTRATWTVRHVQPATDRVCSNSRIPDGYVIKQAVTSGDCTNPTTQTNQALAYDIKLAGEQETVCAFSPIPPGYLVSQIVNVPNCISPNAIPGSGFSNGHAYVIKRAN